jgi:hypothetical protein
MLYYERIEKPLPLEMLIAFCTALKMYCIANKTKDIAFGKR